MLFREALEFVALDDPNNLNVESIEVMVSVRLLAEMFNKEIDSVVEDVVKIRSFYRKL